ncbi:MAG: type II toxin-antitoxin system HicA family toxin [Elusimicrobiota bacterium]
MKVRDVLIFLRREGWVHMRTHGSHRQFRHPQRPGTVTVAGHPSMELAPKTLKSIFRQAGVA